MATEVLNKISRNEQDWAIQLSLEKAERDYFSGIESARQDALAEGRQEGIAIGEERGRNQGARKRAIETARILKAANVSLALIADSTGLSPEEVEAIDRE